MATLTLICSRPPSSSAWFPMFATTTCSKGTEDLETKACSGNVRLRDRVCLACKICWHKTCPHLEATTSAVHPSAFLGNGTAEAQCHILCIPSRMVTFMASILQGSFVCSSLNREQIPRQQHQQQQQQQQQQQEEQE